MHVCGMALRLCDIRFTEKTAFWQWITIFNFYPSTVQWKVWTHSPRILSKQCEWEMGQQPHQQQLKWRRWKKKCRKEKSRPALYVCSLPFPKTKNAQPAVPLLQYPHVSFALNCFHTPQIFAARSNVLVCVWLCIIAAGFRIWQTPSTLSSTAAKSHIAFFVWSHTRAMRPSSPPLVGGDDGGSSSGGVAMRISTSSVSTSSPAQTYTLFL